MCVECDKEKMTLVRCHTSVRYAGEAFDTFVAGKEYRAYVFYSDDHYCYALSALYNDTDDIAISYGEERSDDEDGSYADMVETLTRTEMFTDHFELV